jgi:DNA invertase Pin-like site-specific DNA recombinase
MQNHGYARCSTSEQKQDIERQKRELTAQGATKIHGEYISGVSESKPKLDALLAAIEKGDTVTVTEVSRLSRSIHQLCHIEDIARKREIKLNCGSLSLDYTTGEADPTSRAMFFIMGIFAELERGVTVERIKSGIANAKEKGAQMGRPRKTAADIPATVRELLPAYSSGEITIAEYARRTGLTRPSIYKYIRLMDVEPKDLKQSRHLTAAAVPPKIKEHYPAYIDGKLGVAEYARKANVSRDTIYRWIAILKESTGSNGNV